MKVFFLSSLLFITLISRAQSHETENLLIIGWDGVRWQEIFTGIDSAIVNNPAYTKHPSQLRSQFWDDDPAVRRKKLLPFFWSTMVQRGQLYGNRLLGSKVDVSNKYNVTQPGFTETLLGFADPEVKGNGPHVNTNTNVLGFINSQPAYKGKVAAIATSNLYPSILNKDKEGIFINVDTGSMGLPGPEFKLLNEMNRLSPKLFGERLDLVTYFNAKEYVRQYHPRVLYLEMGETDNYAHIGSYDWYISSLHGQENLIADLWNYIQTIPQYTGKTTLLISCDHGRGDRVKSQWSSHGPNIEDSKNIFVLAMGPDMPVLGEVSGDMQLYQGQIAATLAKFLGLDYAPAHPVLPPIDGMFRK